MSSEPNPGYFQFDHIIEKLPAIYHAFALSTVGLVEHLCKSCDLQGSTLVDICAGTATALNESHLRGVAAAVEASLPPDAPFLTYFSFGEQGMVGGRARHGNLMIGVTLFGGV